MAKRKYVSDGLQIIAQFDEIQRGDDLSPDRQLQLLVLSYLIHMHVALWRDEDSAHERKENDHLNWGDIRSFRQCTCECECECELRPRLRACCRVGLSWRAKMKFRCSDVCLAWKMFLVMFHFRLLLPGWRAENLGLSGPWLIRDAH